MELRHPSPLCLKNASSVVIHLFIVKQAQSQPSGDTLSRFAPTRAGVMNLVRMSASVSAFLSILVD
jgi:hypothetical protein